MKNQNIIVTIMVSVIAIILGLIMLLAKTSLIIPIITIIGILLIIYGVYKIVRVFLSPTLMPPSLSITIACIAILAGILLSFIPELILTFINVLLAIILIIYGLSKVAMILSFKKLGLKISWVNYVIAGIWIVLGILILVTPYFTQITIDVVLALILIIFGINNLFSLKRKEPKSPNQKIVIDQKD